MHYRELLVVCSCKHLRGTWNIIKCIQNMTSSTSQDDTSVLINFLSCYKIPLIGNIMSPISKIPKIAICAAKCHRHHTNMYMQLYQIEDSAFSTLFLTLHPVESCNFTDSISYYR